MELGMALGMALDMGRSTSLNRNSSLKEQIQLRLILQKLKGFYRFS